MGANPCGEHDVPCIRKLQICKVWFWVSFSPAIQLQCLYISPHYTGHRPKFRDMILIDFPVSCVELHLLRWYQPRSFMVNLRWQLAQRTVHLLISSWILWIGYPPLHITLIGYSLSYLWWNSSTRGSASPQLSHVRVHPPSYQFFLWSFRQSLQQDWRIPRVLNLQLNSSSDSSNKQWLHTGMVLSIRNT